MNELFLEEREYNLIPINLSFFADQSSGDKTEDATPRKKKKAREEGQVAKSQEITAAFMFIFIFWSLRFFSGYMIGNIKEVFTFCFQAISDIREGYYDIDFINKLIVFLFARILLIVLPIFAVAIVVGIITNVVQVGWHPTLKPIMPKFSKLNPMKGFKRIFSMRALVELVKSLAKFAIIAFAIYNTLKDKVYMLYSFFDMSLFDITAFVGNLAIDVGMTVGGWYLAIAIADFAYQKFKHIKELRMTKQEVKEEYKQTEGNPQIKGQIRQRMREASMRRMMQEVPEADVVITNPTHYAVALKYDRIAGEAPIVIAKGVDFLAQRIKEKATENDVAIVENKILARALYETVNVGKEIPPELYQSTAEILAYVYKLKNIA